MMDVCHDEMDRGGVFVLDPMRARPVFGKDLSRVNLFRRAVIMVVGQHTGQQVDDSRIAAMAVHPDMTAGRNHRAAEAQFATLDAVDLIGEVDRGEYVLADQLVVGRRALLSEDKAGTKKCKSGRQSSYVMNIAHFFFLPQTGRIVYR